MALQSPKYTTWESWRARLFKDLKSNIYVAIAAIPYIPQQFPVRHSKAESVFIAWQQCSVKFAFLLHFQQGIGFTILQHSKENNVREAKSNQRYVKEQRGWQISWCRYFWFTALMRTLHANLNRLCTFISKERLIAYNYVPSVLQSIWASLSSLFWF